MHIAALPDDTTRAIRSSLTLNDAISIVKELIDNSIDSCATNIVVEISANTIDVIQVRDNGSGIGIEDRQLLCKRGYTSKIRTLQDLARLGGTSLGFRGEALASVAKLSETVTFTTRVDGETVASQLVFDPTGRLKSSSSASHGTGTTVRVTKFLDSIPVRRQTAQKQASKSIGAIKHLLHEYAAAKPKIRFQLKILKSRSELKDNWLYAPCKDSTDLRLIASKLATKDTVSQCCQEHVASQDGTITIDALCISRNADFLKPASTDQFVSIDGRPLTAERGFVKDIIAIYRSYLRHIYPTEATAPKKPFILMHLQCSRGFYDVNVEPAKNEVLLENTEAVLDLFRQMCKGLYGEQNDALALEHPISHHTTKQTEQDFKLMLARKSPAILKGELQTKTSNGITSAPTISVQPNLSPKQVTGLSESQAFDMNHMSLAPPKADRVTSTLPDAGPKDTVDEHFQSGANEIDSGHEHEEEEDLRDPRVFNPFTLAKVNSRVLPQELDSSHAARRPVHIDLESAAIDSISTMLPSPCASPERDNQYQNPGPPNRPWKNRQETRAINSELDISDASRSSSTSENLAIKPTLVDSWIARTQNSVPLWPHKTGQGIHQTAGSPSSAPDRPKQIQMSLRKADMSPQSPIKKRMSKFHIPFKRPNTQSTDENQNMEPYVSPGPSSPHSTSSPSDIVRELITMVPPRFGSTSEVSCQELDDIMDFEHRKRATILQHRKALHTQHRSPAKLDQAIPSERDCTENVSSDEGINLSPREPIVSDTDYSSKFSTEEVLPPQPNSASYTQNPHWNRYQKAIRDLSARKDKLSQTKIPRELPKLTDSVVNVASHERSMPSKDPRAYLTRMRRENADGVAASHSRKEIISKLPFETIPPDSQTYSLLAIPKASECPYADKIRTYAQSIHPFDSYIQTGAVKPVLLGQVNIGTVENWDSALRALITARIQKSPDVHGMQADGASISGNSAKS